MSPHGGAYHLRARHIISGHVAHSSKCVSSLGSALLYPHGGLTPLPMLSHLGASQIVAGWVWAMTFSKSIFRPNYQGHFSHVFRDTWFFREETYWDDDYGWKYLDFRAFCSRVKTNRTTKFTTMLRDWKGWLRQKSMEGLMIRFLITQREDFHENDAYLRFDFLNLRLTSFIELFE